MDAPPKNSGPDPLQKKSDHDADNGQNVTGRLQLVNGRFFRPVAVSEIAWASLAELLNGSDFEERLRRARDASREKGKKNV